MNPELTSELTADSDGKSVIAPKDPNIALRILWLDDKLVMTGEKAPILVRQLSRWFDVRHCNTFTKMQLLASRWYPDVILADWMMDSAGASEPDPYLATLTKVDGAGLMKARDVAITLFAAGHFCRVIACSAHVDRPPSEMDLVDPQTGKLDRFAAAIAQSADRPELVDQDVSDLKREMENICVALSIIVQSYRKGLAMVTARGDLVATGYQQWDHLRKTVANAATLEKVQGAISTAPGLAVSEGHTIPAAAVFADVFLDDVTVTDAQSKVTGFCSAVNDGYWYGLVRQHDEEVSNVFYDVLNHWPVRLLRDAKLDDDKLNGDVLGDGDHVLLLEQASGEGVLHAAILPARFPNYRDRDHATCILAMFVVLEAAERVALRARTRWDLAKECETALAALPAGRQGLVPLLNDIARGKRADGIRGTSQIIDVCWEKWSNRVDLNDVVRFAWPLYKPTTGPTVVATSNAANAPGAHLVRGTHWVRRNPGEDKLKVQEMAGLKCAIDRYVAQVATERHQDPGEIRRHLHPGLVL